MISIAKSRTPRSVHVAALNHETADLLNQLDEELMMSRRLRRQTSITLDALDETDRQVAQAPIFNPSDVVQDTPKSGE